MFCQKCGNQLENDAKFCEVCGQPTQPVQPEIQSQDTNSSPISNTNYTNTSFKCALWGSALILLCGIGLLAQPFALLFGVLALKNEEPEKTKAWIGTAIGAIGTVLVIIIAYRWATDGIQFYD